jgi:hypothetical protein
VKAKPETGPEEGEMDRVFVAWTWFMICLVMRQVDAPQADLWPSSFYFPFVTQLLFSFVVLLCENDILSFAYPVFEFIFTEMYFYLVIVSFSESILLSRKHLMTHTQCSSPSSKSFLTI